MATGRIDKVYRVDGGYRISPIYEEHLLEPHPMLSKMVQSIIDDRFTDANDALHVPECLLGDLRINSQLRPLPLNCESEVLTLLFKHCVMETPIKLTANLFDNVPFELLESHLMRKGVSGTEMFDVLLNCKDINRVNVLRPFLYEAGPFLLKLLESMNPSDEGLLDLESDIEGICLSCRLSNRAAHIESVLSHISRYRNHSSNLHFLFYHLIMVKIDPRLASRLSQMMPGGEENARTVVLAAAHAGFDISLYETIRSAQLLNRVKEITKDNLDVSKDENIYEIVEAAIMLGADESKVLKLLSNPNMKHDADLVYTAAFRGYSEQVLLAIMGTERNGWYRSGHCLFYMVPFGSDRLPLTFTMDLPFPVLKRLFECSVKSEFYFTTGPEVYSDDSYAPFLEWLLLKPNYSYVSIEMVIRDRFQKMPKSLAVIWRHLLKEGLDYRIDNVAECYRVVHRRRLKEFFKDILHDIDRVDTAETFLSCLS